MFRPTCTCRFCWPPYILSGSSYLSLLELSFSDLIHKLSMADEDIATKAPESDAKEPSMMSSKDTPAQTGASMGVRYVARRS